MISSIVARFSALVLSTSGFALLFASDELLPMLAPGLPTSAAWLGQLIAAAWLSVALFNWNARDTLLGGIYGRPVLNLNLVLYVVSTLGLLKAKDPTLAMRVLTVPMGIFAVVYAVLLVRGPFDRPPAS